jgi:hypothetical protein
MQYRAFAGEVFIGKPGPCVYQRFWRGVPGIRPGRTRGTDVGHRPAASGEVGGRPSVVTAIVVGDCSTPVVIAAFLADGALAVQLAVIGTGEGRRTWPLGLRALGVDEELVLVLRAAGFRAGEGGADTTGAAGADP